MGTLILNKMAYIAKDPHPPRHFLYLRKMKSYRCEEGEGEEKVSLKTHATARGVGKKVMVIELNDELFSNSNP